MNVRKGEMFMKKILILGDILSIGVVTLIGFATHGELDTSFITRMSAAFFPLVIAWFLAAPWFGLFQPEITSNPKQLWRAALAMLFAAPLTTVLRGFMLNAAIIPIFVVVLGATSAFGIVVWRVLYFFVSHKAR